LPEGRLETMDKMGAF